MPLVVLAAGIAALVAALLLMRGGNPPAGPTVVFNAAPELAKPATSPPSAPAPAPRVPPQSASGVLRVGASPGVAGAGGAPVSPPPTPPIAKVYACREGAIFGVDPEEALVTVNGKTIGKADDWDDAGGGKKYHFEGPGTYYVKLTLEKYATTWVKVVVKPEAEEKYAKVDLGLKKAKDKDKEGEKAKEEEED